jgi:hypothetical protein
MNLERMEQLANEFDTMAEQEPKDFHFNIYQFLTRDRECGTAGCIAGYIAVRHLGVTLDTPNKHAIFAYAQDWLGLPFDQAYALFMNFPTDLHITPRVVAHVLRDAVRNRDINWKVAYEVAK